MEAELINQTESTAEQHREAVAIDDEGDESASSREETIADAVAQVRANKATADPAGPATDAARRNVAAAEESRETLAELISLSEKVRQGDREAQERIVWILDNNPALADWIGDLSQRAEMALINAVSGDVFAFKLARARHVDSMRQELLTEHATPLERWAVENVIMSQLQLQVVDMQFASAVERGSHLGEWSKVLERVAGRFQDSLKSIALAVKASQALSRSSSSAAVAPTATAATKAKSGRVRTRSKPAKRKTAATVAATSAIDCSEQQNCETPVRPRTGANRSTRKPANRVAEFVGTNGAPPSSNGHTSHEPVVGTLDGK